MKDMCAIKTNFIRLAFGWLVSMVMVGYYAILWNAGQAFRFRKKL